MFPIDWSQFIPDIIGGIIIYLFGYYLTSITWKGIINYLQKGSKRFEGISSWLIENWFFSLPFTITIILYSLLYHQQQNWKLLLFFGLAYLFGFLTWILYVKRNVWFRKFKQSPQIVPIPIPPSIGNSYIKDRYINIPNRLNDSSIPFILEQNSLIFDTNRHIRYYKENKNGEIEVDLPLHSPLNNIISINILINSGNSQKIYLHNQIGQIQLVFHNAPPINIDLILGENIREWCPGNSGDFVRETSNTEVNKEVWAGISKNGANAVIDCLRIPIYECMRSCSLEKIIFIHKPTLKYPDTLGVHYSIYGISLEIEKDNTSSKSSA